MSKIVVFRGAALSLEKIYLPEEQNKQEVVLIGCFYSHVALCETLCVFSFQYGQQRVRPVWTDDRRSGGLQVCRQF